MSEVDFECAEPVNPVEPFLRSDRMPHIWCPGCGIGTTVNCFTRALIDSKADLEKLVVVSGIGCTGRVAGYVKLDSFHTTHGRAIPFATGLKLANPNLTVVVYAGDGDLSAIGGNHLIHAARRNIDLTLVCYVNGTYGMTGGQGAPTTPCGDITSTSPFGHLERPLDLCALAQAAGASFVARATAWHFDLLVRLIARGIEKKGFAMVEAVSSCPVYAGRLNEQDTPAQMLFAMRDHAVADPGAPLGPGQFRIGALWDVEAPEYADTYRQHATGRTER